MDRILIIEDDELIADLERDYLAAEGLAADIAADGTEGWERFSKGGYAAVLLDLMLPGKSGFELLKQIRERSAVPVLLVTARKEDIDKIRGFGLGADDYVVKPFSPIELVARVKAHIQIHRSLKEEKNEKGKKIQAGGITICPASYRAYKDGRELELSRREFELLSFFMQNPNIVFTREHLFDQIWGLETVGDMSTVTVHVNHLRDKIEEDPSQPRLIQTVWWVGYRFQA